MNAFWIITFNTGSIYTGGQGQPPPFPQPEIFLYQHWPFFHYTVTWLFVFYQHILMWIYKKKSSHLRYMYVFYCNLKINLLGKIHTSFFNRMYFVLNQTRTQICEGKNCCKNSAVSLRKNVLTYLNYHLKNKRHR